MMIDNDLLASAEWRKSSFSGGGDATGGNCVEVAALADGSFAVRDSKNPGAGVLVFPHTTWLKSL
nr:DUF397 domain-containing protein [Kibdelosporangium sp. MJ126-NF4]CEL18997.1 hypothetical protein [Kibdelosporangium sp. MJ126-NF4]CTQ95200.1 hypothetical protein [Kibdelosporangium sp. MJ126-NF4]